MHLSCMTQVSGAGSKQIAQRRQRGGHSLAPKLPHLRFFIHFLTGPEVRIHHTCNLVAEKVHCVSRRRAKVCLCLSY